MEKIENWDSIEARGMEDFVSLPIGAYECIITGASIYKSEQSGKESFKVTVDIASGNYKDYFKKQFDADTNADKKWNNNATRYLAFQGDNVAYFKGFITSVENSNNGYKWDWDEKTLIGKKICGVFQYEEYENQEGKKGLKVRLSKFRSLDKLNEIQVSDSIKMLDGSYMNYCEYKENENNSNINNAVEVIINDDDLPF